MSDGKSAGPFRVALDVKQDVVVTGLRLENRDVRCKDGLPLYPEWLVGTGLFYGKSWARPRTDIHPSSPRILPFRRCSGVPHTHDTPNLEEGEGVA